jgi:hypothetical protein
MSLSLNLSIKSAGFFPFLFKIKELRKTSNTNKNKIELSFTPTLHHLFLRLRGGGPSGFGSVSFAGSGTPSIHRRICQ